MITIRSQGWTPGRCRLMVLIDNEPVWLIESDTFREAFQDALRRAGLLKP